MIAAMDKHIHSNDLHQRLINNIMLFMFINNTYKRLGGGYLNFRDTIFNIIIYTPPTQSRTRSIIVSSWLGEKGNGSVKG